MRDAAASQVTDRSRGPESEQVPVPGVGALDARSIRPVLLTVVKFLSIGERRLFGFPIGKGLQEVFKSPSVHVETLS